MNEQKEIVRITSAYFEDNIDYLKLSKATKEYKFLLDEICGQSMDTEDARIDLEFDNGKAIGTFWAASCLDDYLRTRQFIRGINNAIEDKMISQKPLHILYAGTGPYATLILPLIFRYSKEDIKYTFLEVNPLSFQLLQNLTSKLGLEDYDITFVNEDATKYQINSTNVPDIIISETMQNALAKEQQVPIFLNLMSQVKNDSIFIPEKIELFIGLQNRSIQMHEPQIKHYFKEKKVFEVSIDSMFPDTLPKKQKTKEVTFEKVQTVIGVEKLKNYDQLVIITEIHVYKNEKIGINQSGLTTPICIQDIDDDLKEPIQVETQYEVSSEPKLDYKITFANSI